MAESEEKEKAFKVQDRRRFSPEGELKPEFRESEGDKPASAEEARPEAASVSQAAAAAAPEKETPPVEISFSAFVMSISTQALMHLGEVPDPASGKIEHDLVAAQQLIDILGMLLDKTKGNLTADEHKLLDTILFDLRLKYVEIARQAGR
jgi:Domain of unknown function (DUF1844)